MEETRTKEVDILEVIWLKKVEICLFSIIVSVVAYVTSSFFPKEYVAKSTVLISPPKYSLKERFSFLSLKDYEEMARSSVILESVISQLSPQYPHYQNMMYPEILQQLITVNYENYPSLSGGPKSRAALVIIQVLGSDKVFIKDFANTLVSLVIEKGRQLRTDEIRTIGKDTREQYTLGLESLKSAENELHKILIKNHLESAETDLMTNRTNLKHYEYTLLETNLQLIKLARSIDSSLDTISIKQVKKHLIAAQQIDLQATVKKLKSKILELEKNVYQMRLEEKQLKRRVEFLINNHKALTKRLAKIVLSESETTSDIKLLSRATEPHVPVWPDSLKISLVAGVLSFFLSIITACSKQHIDNLNQT